MDIQQLRYFLKAVDKANLAHAADDLFVSRAALSKSISKLESEVGYVLFERTRNGVQLTEAGKRFKEKALDVVEHYEALEQTISAERKQLIVTVGIPLSFSGCFVPRIEAFNKAHEDVCVQTKCLLDADGQAALDSGQVDILISSFPMQGTADGGLALLHSPLHIVMPTSCALAKLNQVAPEDMKGHDVVYYMSGFSEFTWAPLIEGTSAMYENDIMLTYSRVAEEGMLFPSPLHAIPKSMLDITSRPYVGQPNTVTVYGYLAPHVKNRRSLEMLANELRSFLVFDQAA